MSDKIIIEAEIIEEKDDSQETRVVQVTPELQIERLKTRRAELATERTSSRWQSGAAVLIFSAAFASCAQVCSPW